MASKLDGQLLRAGAPIANAKITRVVADPSWDKEKRFIDTVFTDAGGRFTLPELARTYVVSSIVTYVYHATYTAEVDGQTIDLWRGGQVGIGRFEDFTGYYGPIKPFKKTSDGFSVIFDLADPNRKTSFRSSNGPSPEHSVLAQPETGRLLNKPGDL